VFRTDMNGSSERHPDVDLTDLGFDYASVPSPVAKFLRGQADRIRRQCVTSIIQIGKALLEAKHHLSHGAFLLWVEWEVCIPVRTAQAYMRVASWASRKHATVAHLSPSVLYLLSASSTPEEFADAILKRADAGDYMTPAAMRKELRAWRENGRPANDREDKIGEPFLREGSSWGSTVTTSGTSGAVDEIVAILVRRLSPRELARVREIVISDAVLSDPRLARNLEQALVNNG
jgi:hypothetical protein